LNVVVLATLDIGVHRLQFDTMLDEQHSTELPVGVFGSTNWLSSPVTAFDVAPSFSLFGVGDNVSVTKPRGPFSRSGGSGHDLKCPGRGAYGRGVIKALHEL